MYIDIDSTLRRRFHRVIGNLLEVIDIIVFFVTLTVAHTEFGYDYRVRVLIKDLERSKLRRQKEKEK